MGLETTHIVPQAREHVWAWHTKPGAVTRLTPPFFPMFPLQQADNLASGTTIFALPAGLRWEARHDLSGFVNGHSFTDVCTRSPLRAFSTWRHVHHFKEHTPATQNVSTDNRATTHEGLSTNKEPVTVEPATSITDNVITRLPMATLAPMFAYRQQQLINDFRFAHHLNSAFEGAVPLLSATSKPLTIAITGSRGTVGRALVAQLQTLGHTVISLVRPNPDKPLKDHQREWNPTDPSPRLLDGVDALIHLAGEPIFGRFNQAHKKALYDSRIPPTRKLALLVKASETCQTFVCASAIGYYGHNRGEQILTEESPRGEGVLASIVRDWEEATSPATPTTRVVNIRTGVVLSGRGGVLPLFTTLFATGLGGSLDGGNAHLSWIALDDLTDIYIRALFDPALQGPINATAPNVVTNAEFTQALAKSLKRPAVFPIPAIGPKILLGTQGAEELALADQNVSPHALTKTNHQFRYPTIDLALSHEVGTEALFDSK